MRVEAENGATAGKFDLASRAKAAGLDAIHDTVHEMAKDEPATAKLSKAPETLFQQIISTLPTTFIHHHTYLNKNTSCFLLETGGIYFHAPYFSLLLPSTFTGSFAYAAFK